MGEVPSIRQSSQFPILTPRWPFFSWSVVIAVGVVVILIPGNLTSIAANTPRTGSAPSRDANWTELHPSPQPSARDNLALAYDAKDGYVLEFGGESPAGRLINETWTFAGGAWTKLSLSVVPPLTNPTRMAYDEATQQVILITSSGSPVGQTWSFSAGKWSQLHPAHSPPAAAGEMAYDPAAKELVLYTGVRNGNGSWIQETWAYKQGDWQNLSSAGTALNGIVGYAYDPSSRGVIMIGYNTPSSSPVVSTWIFRNGTWSPFITRNQPSILGDSGFQAMALDTKGGYLLLADSTHSRPSEQAWKFANGTWTRLRPDVVPSDRFYFGMAYDGRDGHVVQFGGMDNLRYDLNQTWTY